MLYTKRKKINTGECKEKLLLIYPKKPHKDDPLRTGVLWIHGGGYETGMAEMAFFTRAHDLVRDFNAIVIAPEYRKSGKAPYPAAIDDCYAALKYMKEHAKELGIRDDQIMVGGESAGGGLTAALCILARDRGEINIAYQMPLYPMIDDRDTESSKDNFSGPTWDTAKNHKAWKRYLGPLYGTDQIPPYAAPSRETDYTNLPPAYTFVGDIEPFLDETKTFIENLKMADVEADIDIYPDVYHAFDVFLPKTRQAIEAKKSFDDHFRYAQEHYFRKQSEN